MREGVSVCRPLKPRMAPSEGADGFTRSNAMEGWYRMSGHKSPNQATVSVDMYDRRGRYLRTLLMSQEDHEMLSDLGDGDLAAGIKKAAEIAKSHLDSCSPVERQAVLDAADLDDECWLAKISTQH